LCAEKLQGQSKAGLTARTAIAVLKGEASAVGFRNLAAEHKTYARTGRLGCKEGDEEVGRV
jgi:hypothetical protein